MSCYGKFCRIVLIGSMEEEFETKSLKRDRSQSARGLMTQIYFTFYYLSIYFCFWLYLLFCLLLVLLLTIRRIYPILSLLSLFVNSSLKYIMYHAELSLLSLHLDNGDNSIRSI